MKKYFFKYFAYIFIIAFIIILIQSGSIFLQYKSGGEAWRRSIFEACVDDLESSLGRSMFPKIKIDGLDLFGSIAHDSRISGYLVRDSKGAVALTVGQTPDGRVLASFLSPEEKITNGKTVRSKRLITTINATFNEKNGAFAVERSKITTDKSKTFVPHDIGAEDILGSITVSYMNEVLLTVDILTYSPRTYIYSRQIIDPIMKSIAISLPTCFLIALIGAWIVSSRNAKFIDCIRLALNRLAHGEDNVVLKENHKNELNEITVAVNELGKNLAANSKSRVAWLNSISHDLNTPATAMKMLTDGMVDGVFKPNKHNLKELQSQNDILTLRIQKVIDYSTLIADTKPNITEINAKFLLQNYKNIISDVKTSVLLCDQVLMQRALDELIKNAYEYGSDVKVTIETYDFAYKITVSNVGTLPKNYYDLSLFEPWTRGDTSRTEGGSGLGLPIVSAVASLHNGKAELIQQGDTVTASITWPLNFNGKSGL